MMTDDASVIGQRIYEIVRELYPICRSITGDGFRETMQRLQERVPMTVHEVPSGTPVLDWTVPKEWNIRDAYIKNAQGTRVVDFKRSNLHVVSYSVLVTRRMPLSELKKHLHSIPEHPDWIPYRTSYYEDTWGFCISYNQLQSLEEGEYDVCIDCTLTDGHLTYGECFLEGDSLEEVLISCHSCHPSLCNDNLSAIGVAVELIQYLSRVPRRYSYRVLFIPGTIGAITWLARNEAHVSRIKHGLSLNCLGDPGSSTYKRSRRGDAVIDRVVEHVLKHSGEPYRVQEFVPYGCDERQYCSPGFNLPVGCVTRSPGGSFPEYHTSADDLGFVQAGYLARSFDVCRQVVEVLEQDRAYVNQKPKGEPQLGRRGIYRGLAGQRKLPQVELALLWVLNLSDGKHTLLDIAERAGISFEVIHQAAETLATHDLLRLEPSPAD
jgi:aminopeptidase-like protein